MALQIRKFYSKRSKFCFFQGSTVFLTISCLKRGIRHIAVFEIPTGISDPGIDHEKNPNNGRYDGTKEEKKGRNETAVGLGERLVQNAPKNHGPVKFPAALKQHPSIDQKKKKERNISRALKNKGSIRNRRFIFFPQISFNYSFVKWIFVWLFSENPQRMHGRRKKRVKVWKNVAIFVYFWKFLHTRRVLFERQKSVCTREWGDDDRWAARRLLSIHDPSQ